MNNINFLEFPYFDDWACIKTCLDTLQKLALEIEKYRVKQNISPLGHENIFFQFVKNFFFKKLKITQFTKLNSYF